MLKLVAIVSEYQEMCCKYHTNIMKTKVCMDVKRISKRAYRILTIFGMEVHHYLEEHMGCYLSYFLNSAQSRCRNLVVKYEDSKVTGLCLTIYKFVKLLSDVSFVDL